MNITIIGQWVPPCNTPRAHRTWNLARAFAKAGHNVTVYALLGQTQYDDCFLKYGIKVKNLGHSIFGCSNSDGFAIKKENGLIKYYFNRIMGRLIGDYFQYPAIELLWMTKKALNKLRKVDYLITVAVPHSIHWGAALSNCKIGCWIADCGDPFMGNPFHKVSPFFSYLEKLWCSRANYITIPIPEAKDAYYSAYHDKIRVIPQGFDLAVRLKNYKKNKVPTFAYSGTVYKGIRDPKAFLEFLCTLKRDFLFVVYRKTGSDFDLFKERLGDKLEIRSYVPRDVLIYELSGMDFLININNDCSVQAPSKLIDYNLTRRPILNVSSDFSEKAQFEAFIDGDYFEQMCPLNLEMYGIDNVAQSFIELLNEGK